MRKGTYCHKLYNGVTRLIERKRNEFYLLRFLILFIFLFLSPRIWLVLQNLVGWEKKVIRKMTRFLVGNRSLFNISNLLKRSLVSGWELWSFNRLVSYSVLSLSWNFGNVCKSQLVSHIFLASDNFLLYCISNTIFFSLVCLALHVVSHKNSLVFL